MCVCRCVVWFIVLLFFGCRFFCVGEGGLCCCVFVCVVFCSLFRVCCVCVVLLFFCLFVVLLFFCEEKQNKSDANMRVFVYEPRITRQHCQSNPPGPME